MIRNWSEKVQGIETLALSRRLRFHDFFRDRYQPLFSLDPEAPLRILEIGCGPGVLAGALHRWYPKASVTGIDLDRAFLAYAKEQEPAIEWIEGDAASLPFAEGTFDVTISNTVSEHVDPSFFFSEQRRVLKENGVCLVLSARRGIKREAPCLAETEEEKRYWEKAPDLTKRFDQLGVGKYAMTEQELPLTMERYGFCDVTTGFAVLDLTPDDPRYPLSMALEMIESRRASDRDAVKKAGGEGYEAILRILDEKYERRVRQKMAGEKQWDTETSLTQIVRGIRKADS